MPIPRGCFDKRHAVCAQYGDGKCHTVLRPLGRVDCKDAGGGFVGMRPEVFGLAVGRGFWIAFVLFAVTGS